MVQMPGGVAVPSPLRHDAMLSFIFKQLPKQLRSRRRGTGIPRSSPVAVTVSHMLGVSFRSARRVRRADGDTAEDHAKSSA